MKGVGHVAIDSLVPGDAVLGALTDAAVLRDPDEMVTARARGVEELGTATTVRALAVAANFEMMNRLLDAVGVGPPTAGREIGDAIGVPLPTRLQ
jgi:hypothetical protein